MSNRALSHFLFLLGLTSLPSCASPSFQTSQPLETAQSLPEALRLCDEFSLPEKPTRPVMLRPLVECVSRAGKLFSGSASEDFQTFAEELRQLYADQNGLSWTPRTGLEIEVAAHAILRQLWGAGAADRSQLATTSTEREMVLRHFKITARAIQAEKWSTGAEPVLEPRLESLRALVAGLADSPREAGNPAKIAPGPGPGNVALFGTLCERYGQLTSELKYLSSLWQDLVDMTLIDPQSALNERARRRYFARLDRAVADGQQLRIDMQRGRESAGFRLSACRH